MSKVGFYPGCSLTGTSREYSESVLAVAERLGLRLEEVPDWNCCGATAAHSMNKELSIALPVRILTLAVEAGMTELVVPCAACYNRLMRAHASAKDLQIEILNPLQWVERYVVPQLSEYSKFPNIIDGEEPMKVACYYGCLLVRPKELLAFDRLEDPQTMDKIMQMLGAEPVEWGFKTECCGGGLSISRTQSVARLGADIIEDAVSRSANAIIVACPMCHSNLDMRRSDIVRHCKEERCTTPLQAIEKIPVLYITQAIGLALGISRKELGLHRHFVEI